MKVRPGLLCVNECWPDLCVASWIQLLCSTQLSTRVSKPCLQKVLPCRQPYHAWDLGLGSCLNWVMVATFMILTTAIARIELRWIWDLGLGTPCEPALNYVYPMLITWSHVNRWYHNKLKIVLRHCKNVYIYHTCRLACFSLLRMTIDNWLFMRNEKMEKIFIWRRLCGLTLCFLHVDVSYKIYVFEF